MVYKTSFSSTFFFFTLALLFASANACLIHIRLTTPGQRICELHCRPRGQMPSTECYTPTRVYRAVVCPRHCCRLEGTRCRAL